MPQVGGGCCCHTGSLSLSCAAVPPQFTVTTPLLILGERHLRRVLTEYVTFFNQRRPHQGLGQQCPVPLGPRLQSGTITRRDVLGGIIHDYEREAA
jgi:hypothetical protein